MVLSLLCFRHVIWLYSHHYDKQCIIWVSISYRYIWNYSDYRWKYRCTACFDSCAEPHLISSTIHFIISITLLVNLPVALMGIWYLVAVDTQDVQVKLLNPTRSITSYTYKPVIFSPWNLWSNRYTPIPSPRHHVISRPASRNSSCIG